MRQQLNEMVATLIHSQPQAYSYIYGDDSNPDISGSILFYSLWTGTLVGVEVTGLPHSLQSCSDHVFGFHIHERNRCLGNETDPFADAKLHYNPGECPHPYHAGDLPPLFGNQGTALQFFYTDRFTPEEIVGRTVIIHDSSDDFKSQPSGDSGKKMACGEIMENKM